MDEDTNVHENHTHEDESGKKGGNSLLIFGIVLGLIVLGVVLFARSGKNTDVANEGAAGISPAEEMVMDPNDPAMVDENIDETGTEEGVLDAEGSITVEGGMFYFQPNVIRVKKGTPVKVVFNNVEGMHDFVIDELNVKTQVINGGETETVEFTPEEAGEFEFYCSVGNHREMGMKGTLIVEE